MAGAKRSQFTDEQILTAMANNCNVVSGAAEELGVYPQLLRYWLSKMDDLPDIQPTRPPKIWVYDIETSPIIAYVWSLWKNDVGLNQIERDWCMLTWAGKWLGEDEIHCDSAFHHGDFTPFEIDDRPIIESLFEKFDEADYVVAHNGNKFDQKKANARALKHGLRPPTPYKQIDTMLIAKGNFAFPSNRLEYLAQHLCGYGKIDTGGFDLWRKCMEGDPAAWETMLDYNVNDVAILENVYMALAPWDKKHPNFATHTNIATHACTVCGSTNVEETGKTVKTGVSEFTGYVCNDCGHQMRGRKNVRSKRQMDATLVNAL